MPITSGFPQQNLMLNVCFPKTDALPQHGQKPDKSCMAVDRPVRTPKPKPGH